MKYLVEGVILIIFNMRIIVHNLFKVVEEEIVPTEREEASFTVQTFCTLPCNSQELLRSVQGEVSKE